MRLLIETFKRLKRLQQRTREIPKLKLLLYGKNPTSENVPSSDSIDPLSSGLSERDQATPEKNNENIFLPIFSANQ